MITAERTPTPAEWLDACRRLQTANKKARRKMRATFAYAFLSGFAAGQWELLTHEMAVLFSVALAVLGVLYLAEILELL